jgi:hypothetical protein
MHVSSYAPCHHLLRDTPWILSNIHAAMFQHMLYAFVQYAKSFKKIKEKMPDKWNWGWRSRVILRYTTYMDYNDLEHVFNI